MRRLPLLTASLTATLMVGSPNPSAIAAWSQHSNVNTAVCTSLGTQSDVAIAADGSGGAFIVWADLRGGASFDIYAQHMSAAGAPLWTANGVVVCSNSGDQRYPVLVTDGSGGIIVTWEDTRAGASATHIYAQKLNASGASAWTAGGVAVCTATNAQYDPCIASDQAGGAFIAWRDTRQGAATSIDIYVQRVNANGLPLFAANGAAMASTANITRGEISIVADGSSGAIACWSEYHATYFYDVMLQRVSSIGTMLWTSGGTNASGSQTSDQHDPSLCSDGLGGAIVAWTDQRNASTDIYAQHVTASGSSAWSYQGMPICKETTASQTDPHVAKDGNGGALIGWSDPRSAIGTGIYCQRVTANGLGLWTSDGYPACVTAGGRGLVDIEADGSGGALLGWADSRSSSDWTLYAQRIGVAGTALWATNGVAVQTSLSLSAGRFCSDGAAGVIAAWADYRSQTSQDVYAQRVERYGQLGNPEPSITSVSDVKNDQGGSVKVTWSASYLDADPVFGVYEYRVFRSVPGPLLANLASHATTTDSDEAVSEGKWLVVPNAAQATTWEYVGSQLAEAFASYSKVVATTADSVGGSNPRTYFLVEARAGTAASSDRWSSAPDSGYSVDNLPPAAPAPLTGQYLAGTTRLHWNPNTEADLAGYRVYRGSSAAFTPSAATLVGAAPDTGYVDAAGAPYVYKVTAVDEHGNESPVATLVPSGTLGVDGGTAPALEFAAPSPNPARGSVMMRFSTTRRGPVRLVIYDTAGRRVRVLDDAELEPGAHARTLELRDDAGRTLPSGLYLARLEAEGRVLTRRIAAVR